MNGKHGEGGRPEVHSAPGSGAARTADVVRLLQESLHHHAAGRLDLARDGYEQIMRLQPGQPDALHMSGVLAYQAGRYGEAARLIGQAMRAMPPNAGVHVNLGNALQADGRLQPAIDEFRAALALDPRLAVAWNNLGNALRLQGKNSAALDAFDQALSLDSGYTDAWVNRAIACQESNDLPGAVHSYEQAVALDPGHGAAAHMLAALRGDRTEAAPSAHVARLFDEYAVRFDHHLVDTLGYSMPRLLREEVASLSGSEARFERVIDLGCGTGLAGLAFRSAAGVLVGVDLSSGMIERARQRAIYDELRVADVVSALESDTARYDLFICADVFPYFGRIDDLFSAVAGRAAAGALFVFSTELHEGEGFALRPSGRYAHAQDYLRHAAGNSGFTVLTMRTENLRKQRDAWIPGDLVLLRRDA